MHEYFGRRTYHVHHQRFSEIILGKRCQKTAKVDPKTTIAGKSLRKTKVFPEKDNCWKKLAKL
jgi:hypothetical protein